MCRRRRSRAPASPLELLVPARVDCAQALDVDRAPREVRSDAGHGLDGSSEPAEAELLVGAAVEVDIDRAPNESRFRESLCGGPPAELLVLPLLEVNLRPPHDVRTVHRS